MIQWRFPTWSPPAALRRVGSDEFRSWPSRQGVELVPYSPPVGAAAGPPRSHRADWVERNRIEARRLRDKGR